MGKPEEEHTCKDHEEDEWCRVCEAKECFKHGDANEAATAFFAPMHIHDRDQFGKQVVEYLLCRQPCGVAVGNNAQTQHTCDGEGHCHCEEEANGCDDPDKCNTYSCGWNYVALARAAEHAVSLAYIPIGAGALGHGDVLVYNENAVAENKPCDCCTPITRGAFVAVSLKDAILACLAGEDFVIPTPPVNPPVIGPKDPVPGGFDPLTPLGGF